MTPPNDEPIDFRLRLAISDPGATTPRLPNENVSAWSARAVLTSDWYAESIAEARRKGAAEALKAAASRVAVATTPHSATFSAYMHASQIVRETYLQETP